MSDTDAYFIAFRVTVTPALHAFGGKLLQMRYVSEMSLGETDEEF